MLRILCKSKLHGATVTEANLQYTGSLTIDPILMRAADLVPYEQVHVVNVNNGARFETYCIEGAPGSGTMCLNGAAARLAVVGDKIIVISYAQLREDELVGFTPKLVFLDERNQIRRLGHESPHAAEDAASTGRGQAPRE
jgi:aspartate 1-decarboxylase